MAVEASDDPMFPRMIPPIMAAADIIHPSTRIVSTKLLIVLSVNSQSTAVVGTTMSTMAGKVRPFRVHSNQL